MSGPSAAEPLRARLRGALRTAMRERDLVAVRVLRSTLGVIDNAEAVAPAGEISTSGGGPIAGAVPGLGAAEVPRRDLSEQEVTAIVRAEVAERHTAAAEYEQVGQLDRAASLTAEAILLTAHLDAP